MTYYDYDNDCENDITDLKKKSTIPAFQKLNNNSEKFSLTVKIDGKSNTRTTIKNYGSGSQGSLIVNAVTGNKYNIKVGSAKENLLFKVIDATGFNGRKEPLMLYYDSPEQYEQHYFTNISPDAKQQWVQRALSV